MTEQVELTIPVLQTLLAQAESEIARKKSGLKMIGVNKIAVLARHLVTETFAKLTSKEAAKEQRLNVMAILKFQEPFNAHVAMLKRTHMNAMSTDYLKRLLLLVQSEAIAECAREDKAQEQLERLAGDAEQAETFEQVQRMLNDSEPFNPREAEAVVGMLERTADIVGVLHKLEMPELAELVRQAVITKPLLESAVDDGLARVQEARNDHGDKHEHHQHCGCGHHH